MGQHKIIPRAVPTSISTRVRFLTTRLRLPIVSAMDGTVIYLPSSGGHAGSRITPEVSTTATDKPEVPRA